MAIVKWNGSGNWIGNPGDWSTQSPPGTTDIAEVHSGSNDLTNQVTVASIVIDSGATLTADTGALLTANDGINNAGTFVTKTASAVSIGVFTNSGAANIGNSSLGSSTTVEATELTNTGTINLQGNTTSGATEQAVLVITAAAPTDATGTMNVSGDAVLVFGSGGITAIALGAQLALDGAQARVAITGGASALSGLASDAGTFLLRGSNSNGAGGASVTTTTSFSNAGTLGVDAASGDGGSGLTIGGALANTGIATIGNTALSASTTVAATSLVNSGTLALQGNAASGSAEQATLDITGAAPATVTGTIIVAGDADLEFARGGITAIGSGALLELDSAGARITIGATNSALSKLATSSGTFQLRGNNGNGAGGASVTTTKGFTNNGTLQIDNAEGDSGSRLTIGGKLTNDGTIVVGNTELSGSTTVSATSLINNGSLTLQGNNSTGTTDQATLDVASAASVSGDINVSGDADLEFASGAITAIGTGAELTLDGAQARISVGNGTTSALSRLAANNGSLALRGSNGNGAGGVSLTTPTSFANDGTLQVDSFVGDGGCSLTIGGRLTNAGTMVVGNTELSAPTMVGATSLINNGSLILQGNIGTGTTDQVTLDIASAASVSGDINVSGDADLEFASGAITAIGTGAELTLDGAQARISVGNGTNSALSRLAANYGSLALRSNNANGIGSLSLTTTTSFTNDGTLQVDSSLQDSGSSLTIGGRLTNAGTMVVGNTEMMGPVATKVTATSLANDGSLTLQGNLTPGSSTAILDITGAAPSTLTGSVRIAGSADINFASGGITAIAAGALLELDGSGAVMSVSFTGSDSALSKLAKQ
jgi:hypothetical protein